MNGRTVETFRIDHYIMGVRFSGVFVKWSSTVVKGAREEGREGEGGRQKGMMVGGKERGREGWEMVSLH